MQLVKLIIPATPSSCKNDYLYLYNIHQKFWKIEFKTGFSVHYIHLYLWLQVENTKWIFVLSKNDVKCAVFKIYIVYCDLTTFLPNITLWSLYTIKVLKYRGPWRPNYPSNFVWTVSQLLLVNWGLFSLPIGKREESKKTNK